MREKLDSFRERAKTNRLVKFWKTAEQLPGLVALSLSKTIKVYPAVGWVRGDSANNPELLTDLNSIRKENEQLRAELERHKSELPPDDLDLASLDEKFDFKLTYRKHSQHFSRSWTETIEVSFTWLEILAAIGPSLVERPNDTRAKGILAEALCRKHQDSIEAPYSISIVDDDFETIRVQLETQGLISLKYSKSTKGTMALFWYPTERGKREITRLRSVPPSKQ